MDKDLECSVLFGVVNDYYNEFEGDNYFRKIYLHISDGLYYLLAKMSE